MELLTIDELANASGVSTRTVRFYCQKKLLPPPSDFKGRVALYGVSHLERLKIIRTLKENYFMPLALIKEIIESPERLSSLSDGLQVNDEIFKLLGYVPPTISASEMLKQSGLKANEIKCLQNYKIIQPSEDFSKESEYSEADLAIAKRVKALLDLNFTLEEISILPQTLSGLARTAVEIGHKKFHDCLKTNPEKGLKRLEQVIDIHKELTMLIYERLLQEAAKKHLVDDLTIDGNERCCRLYE